MGNVKEGLPSWTVLILLAPAVPKKMLTLKFITWPADPTDSLTLLFTFL